MRDPGSEVELSRRPMDFHRYFILFISSSSVRSQAKALRKGNQFSNSTFEFLLTF